MKSRSMIVAIALAGRWALRSAVAAAAADRTPGLPAVMQQPRDDPGSHSYIEIELLSRAGREGGVELFESHDTTNRTEPYKDLTSPFADRSFTTKLPFVAIAERARNRSLSQTK